MTRRTVEEHEAVLHAHLDGLRYYKQFVRTTLTAITRACKAEYLHFLANTGLNDSTDLALYYAMAYQIGYIRAGGSIAQIMDDQGAANPSYYTYTCGVCGAVLADLVTMGTGVTLREQCPKCQQYIAGHAGLVKIMVVGEDQNDQ